MRRVSDWDYAKVVEYNLRDGGTAVSIFEMTQPSRIRYSRWMLGHILEYCHGRPRIIEPGCSAGDLSGYFTDRAEVTGYDIVPAAVAAAKARYPGMEVIQAAIEDVEPQTCDVVVLCEFLEHVVDPMGLCRAWLPGARFSLISIPLLSGPTDPEPGHVWAYEMDDIHALMAAGGHRVNEWIVFPSAYQTMLAIGERV